MAKSQLDKATQAPQGFDLDVRPAGARKAEGAEIRQFTFATPFTRRRAAYLVRPESGKGPFAAILYVHWYEPEAHDSNREQFLDEATKLAAAGAVSLLIETVWSDRDWFIKRTQAEDYQTSIEQVAELRLAMDLLLSEPDVDAKRFAYVGHDFGAMYGVLAGALDGRPSCYTLMAGTPRFPDWFLYYPALEGEPRQEFIKQMAALDPIAHVAALAGKPLLFQFADEDPHVPKERTEEFFAAAADPKQLNLYRAGHGLNDEASQDRVQWLSEQLNLSKLQTERN